MRMLWLWTCAIAAPFEFLFGWVIARTSFGFPWWMTFFVTMCSVWFSLWMAQLLVQAFYFVRVRASTPHRKGHLLLWRAWRVSDGRLLSIVTHFPWPPGKAAVACCHFSHQPPALKCECGIYALNSPSDAERGARAEFAYPFSLEYFRCWHDHADSLLPISQAILTRYGLACVACSDALSQEEKSLGRLQLWKLAESYGLEITISPPEVTVHGT